MKVDNGTSTVHGNLLETTSLVNSQQLRCTDPSKKKTTQLEALKTDLYFLQSTKRHARRATVPTLPLNRRLGILQVEEMRME